MTSAATPTQPSIVIIGAGFGGLGMAMELQRAGLSNFTLLERAPDIGGVWRENTYPGAGCDIPSPLYSWSYEPKSDWPKRFSLQRDIQNYMRDVAIKHGLPDKTRYNTQVTDAEFDESTGKWTIRTADGAALSADILIPAAGQLSQPAMPNIPGIGTFQGESFHSAEWNHDIALTGKRVAAIGTGASAIQYIPEIQPKVAHLTLFQRTAAWIVPRPDTVYRPVHHAVFKHFPPARLAERFFWWGLCEFLALAIADFRPIRRIVTALANFHRRRQVPDPELRAKLTPDYPAACKRALFSNDYFPALAQPNVHVETTAITAITPTGVKTADGVQHDVDVIIYGTGFKGTEFLWPMNISGIGGRKLNDVWAAEGARAYLGMAVPGFPNMFMMYGPNTNLGVGSIVYMHESQARYIRQMVEAVSANPHTFYSVKPAVEEEFDEHVQARMSRTPWVHCSSWYRNAAGRITNNWPGTVTSYRLRTRKADLATYDATRVDQLAS